MKLSSTQVFFLYYTASSVAPRAVPASGYTVSANSALTRADIAYAAGEEGWLSAILSPPGTTPGVSINFSPVLLSSFTPGTTHTALVKLTPAATVDPASQLTVSVSLYVVSGNAPTPALSASVSSLSFSSVYGSAAPPAQQFTVSVAGSTATLVSADAAWLSLSAPLFTSTPGTLTVTAQTAGLDPGTYNGNITFLTTQQLTVPVILTVNPAPITVTPASLTFDVPQDYGFSAPQFIQVSTAVPLPFVTYRSDNWIQPGLDQATTPALVPVRINSASLPPGNYTGTVSIQQGSRSSMGATTDVPITLRVGPPAAVSLVPGSVTAQWTQGDPAPPPQVISVRSASLTPPSFSVTASVVNGSGWLSASPATGSAPSAITISLNPASLAPGIYYGTVTLTPAITGASPQAIAVSLTVSAPPVPVITAVQSAASGATGAVSPGEFVTLVGSGVGPKTLVLFPPDATALPTKLGETTVTFDGVAAPLIYASSGATTAQVPYTLKPGQPTSISVTYAGRASSPLQLPVQAIAPGLFTADSTGKGPLAALNQDLTVNSASNPAAPGTVVVLFGTGEGVTNPPVTAGSFVSLVPPYPQPLVRPAVTFAGIQGQIQYAGEAPGSVAGLFQINVTLPPNLPSGAVPVQVSYGTVTTPSGVTVWIR